MRSRGLGQDCDVGSVHGSPIGSVGKIIPSGYCETDSSGAAGNYNGLSFKSPVFLGEISGVV